MSNKQIVPLAVHPWPIAPEHLELMKRAREELTVDFLVQPVEALPGSPGRVLALGALPSHLCDVVLVDRRYVGVYEAVREAMRQVLLVPSGAIYTIAEPEYIQSFFPGAVEITDTLARDFDGEIMDAAA